LDQIGGLIYREDEFIAEFLQVNDSTLTFADYMGLDNYFRRQATRSANVSQSTTKLVRGAMDLIFGFLPQEMKQWVDEALAKNDMWAFLSSHVTSMFNIYRQITGMIVCLEKFMIDASDKGNGFLLGMLSKQHTRLKGLFDRHVVGVLINSS
jgi:exocyst complex component 1